MRRILRCIFLSLFCLSLPSAFAQNPQKAFTDDNGVVITQSAEYLFPGEEIQIEVIGTCDAKNRITKVVIGGMNISFYKKQIAAFKTTAGAVGFHEIPVVVHFANNNSVSKKTYRIQYTVGVPTFSINIDRMNVLYIGIDNPVSFATSKVGDEELIVSISGGGGMLSRVGAGQINVRVKSPTDNCFISLSANGKLIGKRQFRVRELPPPIGQVGAHKSGDTVSVNEFIAQEGISTTFGHVWVPIDIKYQVEKFSLSIQTENGIVKTLNFQGNLFTDEAKQFMKDNLKSGMVVTIGNLFVKMPNKSLMKLLPLIYYITASSEAKGL